RTRRRRRRPPGCRTAPSRRTPPRSPVPRAARRRTRRAASRRPGPAPRPAGAVTSSYPAHVPAPPVLASGDASAQVMWCRTRLAHYLCRSTRDGGQAAQRDHRPDRRLRRLGALVLAGPLQAGAVQRLRLVVARQDSEPDGDARPHTDVGEPRGRGRAHVVEVRRPAPDHHPRSQPPERRPRPPPRPPPAPPRRAARPIPAPGPPSTAPPPPAAPAGRPPAARP